MNRAIYLITGPSGAGKTTLADYLASHGHQSIDADSTPGLCFYVNKSGKPVPHPADADAAWWDKHNYVWELDRLRKMIRSLPGSDPVFLCGNAGNINRAWDMFAAVFYLDLPTDLILKRISRGDRDHTFGKSVDESDQLLRWAAPFKAEMLSLGAISVNASKSVPQVAADILAQINSPAGA